MATATTEEAFNPRFLVVSLGNPAPHGESLHSAGHLALQSLQQQLHRQGQNQPSFSSNRIAKKATKASLGDKYTLLQCPTLMNISGPWIARAWKEVLENHIEVQNQDPNRPLGLVIVNDDLEEDMAVVKVMKWAKSHRGHNGLKSIMASMKPTDYPDSKWARISVGIGRPEARDAATVSNYVLKPWSKYQKDVLYEKSAPGVLAALKEIEDAWRSATAKGAGGEVKGQTKKTKKERQNQRETVAGKAVDTLADAVTIGIVDP
ncbi:Peptidyl-tRNA hydrolase [Cytospora mali]|uniref:peptidyl-tRNA hydrolase n=1 Tax=Cytospora mali TaxID=578113 RepID=A0A194V076_CYTMA|nr:Peptidyl-tRNA hydrolase [Valsa mali var. pyri (nom. inval.)]